MEKLHGDGFAAALITCAAIVDICIDAKGCMFALSALAAFCWMVWINAE